MGRNYNNTTTVGQLTGAVSSGDVSLPVSDFTGYPDTPFTITLGRNTASEEVCLVTNVVGPNLTVTRGYDGTAAQAHSAGATVEHTAIAKDFQEAGDHISATTGIHGTSGDLVGTSGVQTLTQKTLTAPVANADLTAGDAITLRVPSGAGVRNLLVGKNTSDVIVLTVDSSGNITGVNLHATGTLETDGNLQVDGNATITGTLTIGGGSLTIPVNLTVTGTSTLTGNATVGGTLGVTGATTLSSTLAVSGALTGAGATFSGNVTASSSPSTNNHLVNKAYADALGTTSNTANTIVRRDASGDITVHDVTAHTVVASAAPTAVNHLTRKDYVDGLFKTSNGGVNVTSNASALVTITHNLGTSPSAIFIQSKIGAGVNHYAFDVTARNATTFTYATYYNGVKATNNNHDIFWVVFA